MKFALVLALIALIAGPELARAEDAVPKWTVDRKKSTIEFSSFKNGKPYTSAFQAWSADIAFDPANLPASKATVTIDTRSATTGDKTFTEYVSVPKWFDPGQTPYATVQILSIRHVSDTLYNANGTLYLYNKAKTAMIPVPGVSFPIYASVKGNAAVFKSNFTFAIPDFSPAGLKRSAYHKIRVNMLLNTTRADQSGK